MCYAIYEKERDLTSCVTNLLQRFQDMEFDAEHEQIYDTRASKDDIKHYKVLAKSYKRAHKACEQFLNEEICHHKLTRKLKDLKLDGFINYEKYTVPSFLEVAGDEEMTLKFKKTIPNAFPPTKGSSEWAAGYDLAAPSACDIPARGRDIVDIGLKVELPKGCYGRIAPRSSLAYRNGIDIGGKIKKNTLNEFHNL